MVTTRSQKAQTHIDDYATKRSTTPKSRSKTATTQNSPPKANTSKKRKSADVNEDSIPTSTSKRTKTSKPDSTHTNDTITINRALVLHLWSACLTHTVYPELSWDTCLSAGAGVSGICAVAKGRSIGTISEKDSDSKSKSEDKDKDEDVQEIKVMHFTLPIEDNLVLVGAKAKSANEDALRKKFGESEYERVKGVFNEVLRGWKGYEEELNDRGFGMYEGFRPEVNAGQKGWGKKGELSLDKVREIVQR